MNYIHQKSFYNYHNRMLPSKMVYSNYLYNQNYNNNIYFHIPGTEQRIIFPLCVCCQTACGAYTHSFSSVSYKKPQSYMVVLPHCRSGIRYNVYFPWKESFAHTKRHRQTIIFTIHKNSPSYIGTKGLFFTLCYFLHIFLLFLWLFFQIPQELYLQGLFSCRKQFFCLPAEYQQQLGSCILLHQEEHKNSPV